jgi:hypothetical protein
MNNFESNKVPKFGVFTTLFIVFISPSLLFVKTPRFFCLLCLLQISLIILILVHSENLIFYGTFYFVYLLVTHALSIFLKYKFRKSLAIF